MAEWIRAGEPVNEAERRVFEYLENNLPDEYVFYSNIYLIDGNEEREFDCIVLGKYAIYVLEIKDYEIIEGDALHWEVSWSDSPRARKLVPDHHPIIQVENQARILHGCLGKYGGGLSRSWVQGLVCLASEIEPQKKMVDQPTRLEKVQWYQGIEKILTDSETLRRFTNKKIEDISALRPELKMAFSKNFVRQSPARRSIRGYRIIGHAWKSTRYEAYEAQHEGNVVYDYYLLKVYKMPDWVEPERFHNFVTQLTNEVQALQVAMKDGDYSSGGRKYVVYGCEVFPLIQSKEYVVVTEWVNGKRLADLLDRKELPGFPQRWQMAAQACRGVAFCHSAEIIHRNLTAENIIWANEDRCIKIINFDFAKFGDRKVKPGTINNALLTELNKSWRYLAPELRAPRTLPLPKGSQAEVSLYHDANKQTDIYALGVVLYELLTGKVLPAETEKPDFNRLDQIQGISPRVKTYLEQMCDSDPAVREQVSLVDVAESLEVLPYDQETSNGLPELAPDSEFHPYRIIGCLARTYMSVVYKAMDESINIPVVIKFLREPKTDTARQSLSNSAAILRKIESKYTARLERSGWVNVENRRLLDHPLPGSHKVFYQVLEYIDGPTLKEVINSRRMDSAEVLDLAHQMIEAVQSVHQVDWTHRDIKPDNFILDPNHRVRIIDFGLSQRVSIEASADAFSPGYTPPEVLPQNGGRPWSFAGDIYSLTCAIIALMCGENYTTPENGPNRSWDVIEKTYGKTLRDFLEKISIPNPASGAKRLAYMQLLSGALLRVNQTVRMTKRCNINGSSAS